MGCCADEIFMEAYKKYYKVLLSKAYAVTNNFQMAEDCVQEAYLILYERLKDDPSGINVYSFLNRVTHNVAIKAASKEKDLPIESLMFLAGFGSTAEDEVIKRDMLDSLDRALRKQPVLKSSALIYHFGYDIKYRCIGELVGLNQGQVKSMVRQTIKDISNEMRRKS